MSTCRFLKMWIEFLLTHCLGNLRFFCVPGESLSTFVNVYCIICQRSFSALTCLLITFLRSLGLGHLHSMAVLSLKSCLPVQEAWLLLSAESQTEVSLLILRSCAVSPCCSNDSVCDALILPPLSTWLHWVEWLHMHKVSHELKCTLRWANFP